MLVAFLFIISGALAVLSAGLAAFYLGAHKEKLVLTKELSNLIDLLDQVEDDCAELSEIAEMANDCLDEFQEMNDNQKIEILRLEKLIPATKTKSFAKNKKPKSPTTKVKKTATKKPKA